ncbi:MAG: pyridoxamine 5'-phosphate oxidase family protein [Actinomycetota bacterium]
MAVLPDEARRILRALSFPLVAHPDGERVLLSPVWVHVDDDDLILINTTETRAKGKYLQTGAPVTLCALDPANPYHYVTVHGRVADRSTEDGLTVIGMLCRKYHDGRPWAAREGERRVTIRIEAERALLYG